MTKKRSKGLIPKIKQRRLRAITLQRAIENIPILLSKFWKTNNLKVHQNLFRILGAPIIYSFTMSSLSSHRTMNFPGKKAYFAL